MVKLAKKVAAAREGIDRKKLYALGDAVQMIKSRASAKFDETVEIAMNLGVDPRHADQMVRGVVNLPNGTGRTVRVAVFARDAKAEEARKAGADVGEQRDLARAAGEIGIQRIGNFSAVFDQYVDAALQPVDACFGGNHAFLQVSCALLLQPILHLLDNIALGVELFGRIHERILAVAAGGGVPDDEYG